MRWLAHWESMERMTATAATMRRMQMADGRPYLLPLTPLGSAMLATIPIGEEIDIKIARERSLPQHKLFWALLEHVAKASAFETPEKLLAAIKLRLGRYDLLAMPNGKVVPVPQSISFGKMPQDEFRKFFDQAVELICAEVVPGADKDGLLAEVEAMLK